MAIFAQGARSTVCDVSTPMILEYKVRHLEFRRTQPSWIKVPLRVGRVRKNGAMPIMPDIQRLLRLNDTLRRQCLGLQEQLSSMHDQRQALEELHLTVFEALKAVVGELERTNDFLRRHHQSMDWSTQMRLVQEARRLVEKGQMSSAAQSDSEGT